MMKFIKGFTLIELLVALAVSSVVAIGMMKAYVAQTVIVVQHGRTTQATEDGREAFTVISRLLEQSVSSSIVINQPNSNNTTIDFLLPEAIPIWPNITAPFDNNAVRLTWSDEGNDANIIFISSATDVTGLDAATKMALAGGSSTLNSKISGLTLNNNNDASFSFTLTSQVGNGNSNTPLTASFEGLVLPRN